LQIAVKLLNVRSSLTLTACSQRNSLDFSFFRFQSTYSSLLMDTKI